MSYSDMTDTVLLNLLKEDDAAAFNTLFSRFWDRLYRTALAKTGESQAAFDIVQDIFVQLWQQRTSLEIRESLPQYFAGMLRNKAFNYYRASRRKRQQLQELTELLAATAGAGEYTINVKEELEKEKAWDQAVDSLPERMKEVYILRSRHRYSFRNIADALHIKPQTAKNAFSRAQALLRDHFSDIVPPLILLVAASAFLLP